VLRELCGLTHGEIALAVDTTVGAAKQSILEARRELHEYAAGREMACAPIRTKISAGDRRVLRARSARAHLPTRRSQVHNRVHAGCHERQSPWWRGAPMFPSDIRRIIRLRCVVDA
jgi:hypothetical protein